MPRSVNTPQEQILHRKGTLFNFTHTLYQTRYDYFQNVPLGKAHLGQGLVDSPDNHRRRVKGGEGAGPGRRVFL